MKKERKTVRIDDLYYVRMWCGLEEKPYTFVCIGKQAAIDLLNNEEADVGQVFKACLIDDVIAPDFNQCVYVTPIEDVDEGKIIQFPTGRIVNE